MHIDHRVSLFSSGRVCDFLRGVMLVGFPTTPSPCHLSPESWPLPGSCWTSQPTLRVTYFHACAVRDGVRLTSFPGQRAAVLPRTPARQNLQPPHIRSKISAIIRDLPELEFSAERRERIQFGTGLFSCFDRTAGTEEKCFCRLGGAMFLVSSRWCSVKTSKSSSTRLYTLLGFSQKLQLV